MKFFGLDNVSRTQFVYSPDVEIFLCFDPQEREVWVDSWYKGSGIPSEYWSGHLLRWPFPGEINAQAFVEDLKAGRIDHWLTAIASDDSEAGYAASIELGEWLSNLRESGEYPLAEGGGYWEAADWFDQVNIINQFEITADTTDGWIDIAAAGEEEDALTQDAVVVGIYELFVRLRDELKGELG